MARDDEPTAGAASSTSASEAASKSKQEEATRKREAKERRDAQVAADVAKKKEILDRAEREKRDEEKLRARQEREAKEEHDRFIQASADYEEKQRQLLLEEERLAEEKKHQQEQHAEGLRLRLEEAKASAAEFEKRTGLKVIDPAPMLQPAKPTSELRRKGPTKRTQLLYPGHTGAKLRGTRKLFLGRKRSATPKTRRISPKIEDNAYLQEHVYFNSKNNPTAMVPDPALRRVFQKCKAPIHYCQVMSWAGMTTKDDIANTATTADQFEKKLDQLTPIEVRDNRGPSLTRETAAMRSVFTECKTRVGSLEKQRADILASSDYRLIKVEDSTKAQTILNFRNSDVGRLFYLPKEKVPHDIMWDDAYTQIQLHGRFPFYMLHEIRDRSETTVKIRKWDSTSDDLLKAGTEVPWETDVNTRSLAQRKLETLFISAEFTGEPHIEKALKYLQAFREFTRDYNPTLACYVYADFIARREMERILSEEAGTYPSFESAFDKVLPQLWTRFFVMACAIRGCGEQSTSRVTSWVEIQVQGSSPVVDGSGRPVGKTERATERPWLEDDDKHKPPVTPNGAARGTKRKGEADPLSPNDKTRKLNNRLEQAKKQIENLKRKAAQRTSTQPPPWSLGP